MSKRDSKSGTFEEYTIEDMVGFVSRWASIPFGICVVLVAGSVLNLAPYFIGLKHELGFSVAEQELIRWGVLGAYYGGLVAGPVVDILKYKLSFIVAALSSLCGFIALSMYTDSEKVGVFDTVLIIWLLIGVSFTAAIASIAAITIVIKNFAERVGTMVVSVMLTYYVMAPLFDQSIRNGYFEDIELK